MSGINFSLLDLEGRSYRDLQQLAKSLSLPSNVKKIYLVQLIHAKRFRSAAEVEAIVQRVKQERRQMAQNREQAKKLQGAEISSTSNNQSPPIGHRPRRPGQMIVPCSEVRHIVLKYPRQSLVKPSYIKKTYQAPIPTSSDRVLRSFLKPKKPSNSALSVFKNQDLISLNEAKMDVMGHDRYPPQERLYPKTNVLASCVVAKQRPHTQSQSARLVQQLGGQLVPVTNRMIPYSKPARRQRVLSGIYPITAKVTKETPKVTYEYIQSIGFRRSDGKMSHINALVQKISTNQSRNMEMTMQDLINSNIDSQTINPTQSLDYPNMSSVTDYGLNYQRQSNQFEIPDRSYENEGLSSVFNHNRILAEQVISQKRFSTKDTYEERLPKINEVFSKFSDIGKDVTQPIYVQVGDESDKILNYPYFVGRSNNNTMLESFYNLKNSFKVHQPLLQVATTTATRCVYSTPVIASAMVHTSSVATDAYNVSSCERDSQTSPETEVDPRLYDLLKMADQKTPTRRQYSDHVEDLNTSVSSLERSNSQELGSSATIPEMVEDALEIISQDGDYMERIGMDVRVQCIICSWAGPRFLLENHIRKDHATLVLESEHSEWNISFPLGCLVRSQLWTSQVVAYQSTLYVLSIKYDRMECFVTLSALSPDHNPQTGYVTVYNKLTGEPHSWTGEIESLSPNLPYYTEANCLKLDISRLNLIPNSANLQLVNNELVGLPNKDVVDLDNIQVTVFVKIFDAV